MKNPLLALALLLAPGLAAAGHAPAGSSVFVQNSPLGTGTGIAMGNGEVMGPLCPPDICAPQGDAAAFNAASVLPPPGTKWRSADCTRIPCALEDDPTDPRLNKGDKETPAADANEGEEIVVTAPRKKPTPAPKETPLGAGIIATSTPDGVTFKDSGGRQLTPNETQAILVSHEAAVNTGFDPTGGFGQQGRRNPPAPSAPEASFIGGLLGDGMSALGSFGDAAPTPAPGQPGPVVYKGEVTLTGSGNTAGRVDVDRNIALSRAGGALGALETATKTGEGLGTSNGVNAGGLERAGCDDRNPEYRGLCAE